LFKCAPSAVSIENSRRKGIVKSNRARHPDFAVSWNILNVDLGEVIDTAGAWCRSVSRSSDRAFDTSKPGWGGLDSRKRDSSLSGSRKEEVLDGPSRSLEDLKEQAEDEETPDRQGTPRWILIDADETKNFCSNTIMAWGMAAVHAEGARITSELLLPRVVQDGENIVHPVVGKNLEKIDRLLKSLSEVGYEGHLHLVEFRSKSASKRNHTVHRNRPTIRSILPRINR
jgi:hypothetical protein